MTSSMAGTGRQSSDGSSVSTNFLEQRTVLRRSPFRASFRSEETDGILYRQTKQKESSPATEWPTQSTGGFKRLPGRKRPRPIDKLDMNESIIIPAPDSVLGKQCLDISENFASTPATKKKCILKATPKSILKRKCLNESKQQSINNQEGKKLKLSLPKTRRRKSLINAFSDSVEERQDFTSAVDNDSYPANHPSFDEITEAVENSLNSDNKLINTKTCSEEETVNYSEKTVNIENSTKQNQDNKCITTEVNPVVISENTSPIIKTNDEIDNAKNKRIWRNLPNKKYSLSFGDKNDIKYDKKINSDIINFSLGLLDSQFQHINGFQHCGYAPVREGETWKYGLKMKHVSALCAQIHHTGNDHWLVSFKDESSSHINVADSLLDSARELSMSVEMQFLQMYGRQKLKVSLLKVQQQNNSVDCGIFAIAFTTEFCYTGRKGVLQAEFDTLKMRKHLLNCLENMELTPFPKVRRKLKLKKQVEILHSYSISAECAALCVFPDSFDDMVQCDRKSCQKWFHFKCRFKFSNRQLNLGMQ